ncbi:MAG: response regulator transcription factor [Anaerolineales bacterium]|nr:response regulator transcription factor [Anaerolineales bacterium]
MSRILIVDEDAAVRRLLRIKLKAAGYEISQARDGQEALALFKEMQPDIVIIEPILPDLDGITILSDMQSDTESIPVILVLSSQTADTHITHALQAGADDYVTKPFSPQALVERIRVNLIRAGLDASPAQGKSN